MSDFVIQSDPTASASAVELAVVIPTYNERENVPVLIGRLEQALVGVGWEAIFVDDDSPDGTAGVVRSFAVADPRVRLLHRMGKRGLASACIDGMMATEASYVAVMDADLQHDETILPTMLKRLKEERLDVVVGTRNAEGGSMGEFAAGRVILSRMGRGIGGMVCRSRLSDPMSGFFMVRRDFVSEMLPGLKREGFKILLDILATSARRARVAEVGYTFGRRQFGESKLDVSVGVEYLSLVCGKLLGKILPVRMSLFMLVGSVGLAIHMATLVTLMRHEHVGFVGAQAAATFVAMVGNYFFNNNITFRDRRMRGWNTAEGLGRFVGACSIAAAANILLARGLWEAGLSSYIAGFAGIVAGSLWNLTVSSYVTWGAAEPADVSAEEETSFAPDLEVAR